jgi:hypothetical protein
LHSAADACFDEFVESNGDSSPLGAQAFIVTNPTSVIASPQRTCLMSSSCTALVR